MPDRDLLSTSCLAAWRTVLRRAGWGIFSNALWGCTHIPKDRIAVDALHVQGNHAVSESDIEDRVATSRTPRFLGLFQGVVYDYELFDRYVLERDLLRVERFYRSRGFYEAHARVARVQRKDNGHVEITVVADEGQPVTIGEIRLNGLAGLPLDDSAAALAEVRARLKHGQLFDEELFLLVEAGIRRALADRGFAYAVVKGGADVDLGSHRVDIEYACVPQQKAAFGKITFSGLQGLSEDRARKTLDLAEGEPYSEGRIESAERALLDLGVFGSVKVQPVLRDSTSTTVPLEVHVEPTQLRAVRLGGGVQLDGIRADAHLRTGWEDHNFLGDLRRLTVDLKPGVVFYPTRFPDLETPTAYLPEYRMLAELRQPGLFEARTEGALRAEYSVYPILANTQQETVPGYQEVKGGFGISRHFGPIFASSFYNLQADFPFVYVGPKTPLDPLIISYIDLFASVDLRDDPLRPHKGLYFSTDLQLAGGPRASDPRDWKVQPDVRLYVPISRNVTFAVRGSIGFLFPANYSGTLQANDTTERNAEQRNFDVQVVYFRGFFSGGPTSNRGYPFRGVGPIGPVGFFHPSLAPSAISVTCLVNPSDEACRFPLGGLTLWEATAEVRYRIVGALSNAVFCDSSDVGAQTGDFGFRHPHLSCGGGLRYDTPIGPVRFDVAYRLPKLQTIGEETSDDRGLGLAFGLGEAF